MLPQLLAAALVDVVRSLSGCSLVQNLCIDALISLATEAFNMRCVELWLAIDSAMLCFVYKFLENCLTPDPRPPENSRGK